MDRDVAGGRVGHHLRDDERADAARSAALHEFGVLGLVFGQPADAAADDGAAAEGILLGDVEAAVFDRFEGGDHGKLGEAIHAADGPSVEEFFGRPVLDFAADLDLEFLGVDLLDIADAALAREEAVPVGGHVGRQRRDGAHAGDDDAPSHGGGSS